MELLLNNNNFYFLILNILTYDPIHDLKYDRIKDKKIILNIIDNIYSIIDKNESIFYSGNGGNDIINPPIKSIKKSIKTIKSPITKTIKNISKNKTYEKYLPIILLNAIGSLSNTEIKFASFDTNNLILQMIDYLYYVFGF